ncbi:MAG: hypothetical protein ACJ76F_00310 [Bacteroidia bacterium]
MADITLASKYEFNMGSATIEMGFTTDEQLFTKMMFVKKVTPLTTISSVNIKKGALTSKIQYDIKTRKDNGKEQIFQIVQIDSADEQGIRFINELRCKIPMGCIWNDKLEAQVSYPEGKSASRVYDLQIMWFIKGKTLAGSGRGLQIMMNYGMLTLVGLLLPLPLLVYVIAAGCHRVSTDANGILVKKLGGKYFPWEEVERVDVHKYNIIVTQYGAVAESTFLLVFNLIGKNGTKTEFIIRSLEGKHFVKEMIERKKMPEEMSKLFI